MSISNTTTLALQGGKHFWIYQDKLSSYLPLIEEDRLVWFVFIERQNKERRDWTGWVSQWNYIAHKPTQEEAFERVKREGEEGVKR